MSIFTKNVCGYTGSYSDFAECERFGNVSVGRWAKDLFEAHPEAAGKAIHNVDSETYSMLYGHAVIKAAEMARNGASVEEIIAKKSNAWSKRFAVFLEIALRPLCQKRSGRVSAAAAFLEMPWG